MQCASLDGVLYSSQSAFITTLLDRRESQDVNAERILRDPQKLRRESDLPKVTQMWVEQGQFLAGLPGILHDCDQVTVLRSQTSLGRWQGLVGVTRKRVAGESLGVRPQAYASI